MNAYTIIVVCAMILATGSQPAPASDSLLVTNNELLTQGLNYWASRSPQPYSIWFSNGAVFVSQHLSDTHREPLDINLDVEFNHIAALWGDYHARMRGEAWPPYSLTCYQQINLLSGMLLQHADEQSSCVLAAMILEHYGELLPQIAEEFAGASSEEDAARLQAFWQITLPSSVELLKTCRHDQLVSFIMDDLMLRNNSSWWYLSGDTFAAKAAGGGIAFIEKLDRTEHGRNQVTILLSTFLEVASDGEFNILVVSMMEAMKEVMEQYDVICSKEKREDVEFILRVITSTRKFIPAIIVDEKRNNTYLLKPNNVYLKEVNPSFLLHHFATTLSLLLAHKSESSSPARINAFNHALDGLEKAVLECVNTLESASDASNN